MKRELLVYGAYGYTGRLVVAEALRLGLSPIVAGRNRDRVEAVARPHRLEHRVFDLERASLVDANLSDVRVFLHCAGPFRETWRPAVDACLRARAHYLDITGEIEVLEGVAARDAEARDAGVTLLSGCGFDVVPTDCLAANLARALPRATHLRLAFHGSGRPSRGTSRTAAQSGFTGRVRRNGRLVDVPFAHETLSLEIDGRERTLAAIPWGDVSSAYRTTGIPNVVVYTRLPTFLLRAARLARPLAPLLKLGAVRNALQERMERAADRQPEGPDAEELERGGVFVWGDARDAAGERAEAALRTPNAYALTASSAAGIAARLLAPHSRVPVGAPTPALAFGADFVRGLRGVEVLHGWPDAPA